MFPALRFRLEIVEECTSTSEVLLGRRQEADFHGSALLARRQTAGYGRRGRFWHSGNGNLALSLAFSVPGTNTESVILLPFVAGLAAWRVCREWLPPGLDLRLKWPNDIYLQGRKLSGLIAQARQAADRTDVVLGIGMNLKEVPPELAASTAALAEFGEAPPPEIFAEAFLRELESCFDRARDFAWIRQHWEEAARLHDQPLFVLGEASPVSPLALLPSGELLVRTSTGNERKLSSETVSLRFEPEIAGD